MLPARYWHGGDLEALGVIGVALGVLMRGTAAAIGTVIGAVLFALTLASSLLPDSSDALLRRDA